MTLRLGGDGAITGCTSLENPDLTVSGLTISGSFDAEKVLVASGTAAAPSYTFSGDTDNGLYYAGTNSIGVATAGTSAIVVDASQRVLIGDTSVFANANADDLQIGTTSATNVGLTVGSSTQGQIAFADSGDSRAGLIHYQHTDNSMRFYTAGPSNERIRIDNSGNVGIGTSSPGANLHVDSSSATEIRSSSSGSNALFSVQNSSGVPWILTQRSDTSNAFSLRYVGNNYFNVTTAGRVGIGTTSPSTKMHIADAAAPEFRIVDTTNNCTGFMRPVDSSVRFGTGSNHPLEFHVNSSEAMRITSSGNVGIGTTSPDTDISGSAQGLSVAHSNVAFLSVENTAASGKRYTLYANDSGSLVTYDEDANTERMRIGATGRVNIFASDGNVCFVRSSAAAGTTDYEFGVAYGATNTTNGTISFAVFTNGNAVNTNNSYGAISDIKLKENIVDASSQWDDIKDLRVRNYNFIEGQTHTQIGVVAQEVETVSPGLVSESPDRDEDGNDLGTVTKSVNYSVLYMKAVKALQEAMERIETLEQRLTDAGL